MKIGHIKGLFGLAVGQQLSHIAVSQQLIKGASASSEELIQTGPKFH